MFQRVLIPVDGSPLSDGILTVLRPLFAETGSKPQLSLLEVTDPEDAAAAGAARAHLERLAERLAGLHVASELHLAEGDAAEQILAKAAELAPDLIAMSTHGRSGLTRLVRGSVAERVLRHAPAPVLSANPAVYGEGGQEPSFERILVPLDGSETAEAVLPLVATLAQRSGGKLTLLHVVPFPDPAPSAFVPLYQWDMDKVKAELAPVKQRLVEEDGLEVEVWAREGFAADKILEAAAGHDLVAMTTHGRSGASRWWFGSVAEQVIRHCARPLLVQRSGEAS